MTDIFETTALQYESAASELERAAQHLRVSAQHMRDHEIPRTYAHAFAAQGHLLLSQRTLEELAVIQAGKSQV
jgi:hypothetical protein